MSDLNALIIFAKVVEAKGFSEAARRMAMPISSVSRRVAELEEQLGVRLLERSTRNLRLTDIGREVLAQAERVKELHDDVEHLVSNKLSGVSGTLRLSAPPSISDSLLAPLVLGFQAAYPDVNVHVFITDRIVDHISEGVDLAFRVGDLGDSTMVARKVLTYRHQLVASPAYVATCGLVRQPSDLVNHRLMAFSFWQPQRTWRFRHLNGHDRQSITFHPYLAINEFGGLAAALLAGKGIGDLPPIVQPDLVREGQLIEVMPDWRLETFHLSLVHLKNRHLSRAVRTFREFALQMAPTMFPSLPI
jgi:DNA-binding transcriptional LysR family regulator